MTYLLSKNYEDKTPVFLQDPYIDGTPQVGNTLTARWFVPGYDATDDDWSVAYQWYWGAEDTTLTEAEFDETGQTLVVTADHLHGYLTCRVAVTNPTGTVVKFAANVGPVIDASSAGGTNVTAPVFSRAASVVGTPQVGRILAVDYAVQEVNGVTYSYTFQWYRDEDGVDSPSPDDTLPNTGQTYLLTLADQGKHLKCRVRATNFVDTTESMSTYTAEVQPADDTAPVNAVYIDQAWLLSPTNGGPNGPWILKQANGYYVLEVDITQPTPSGTVGAAIYVANSGITLDLDGHTITYDSGTVPPVAGGDVWYRGNAGICIYAPDQDAEISIPGAVNEVANFTLRNGTLVDAGTGRGGHAVYGYRPRNCIIRDMRIESGSGQDSHVILFRYGLGQTQITDNVLIANTTTSTDRHDIPAAIKFTSFGPAYIARNVIIGGNSSINPKNDTIIENNVLSQNSTVTNGYGVIAYRVWRVTARNNIIIPVSGRGIQVNADGNQTYNGNVILHLEFPNDEFDSELNPCAFRARYGYENVQYYDNFSLGIGGPSHTACSSIYIGQTDSTLPQSEIRDNQCYVVYYGDRIDQATDYAKSVALEGHGPNATQLIKSNEFYSNHLLLSTDGFDGGARQSPLWPLQNNTWAYADGATAYAAWSSAVDAKLAAMGLSAAVQAVAEQRITTLKSTVQSFIGSVALRGDRGFWFTLFGSGRESLVDVLDSTYGSGVDPLSYRTYVDTRTGIRVLRDKISANVRLLNGPTQAVASQAVTVTPVVVATSHPSGDTYTTTTDASGNAVLHAIRYALTRDGGSGAVLSQTETHVDIAVVGVGTKRVAIGDFAGLTELDLTS